MNLALTVFLATTQVITLDQAVQTAAKNQPQLLAAHANTDVAYARAGEARAPLLPQVSGTATYQRATANQQPGAAAVAGFGGGTGSAASLDTWNTLNHWNFGITASQTLWDGTGQLARWRQNVATAEGVEATERATKLSVTLTVRTTYFAAVADKALVGVARDTLVNQDKHLQQTDGQVKVGTQPEIALATARTNVANARVQLIQAENNYEVAKATLNQSMGVERDTSYDVADESIGAVAGEDQPIDPLLAEALQNRPEFVSLEKQVKAQELAVWAAKTAYGPTLSASTGFTDGGVELNNLGWNWTFSLGLNWQLFQGGLTWYTVKEQKANLDGVIANRELIRQQTRLQVEQARLAVKASKIAVVAAEEAVINAKEQLRLAEGRYTAGVGSIIELGDAQVAYTTAAAQKVQADFNVSTARAQLVQALGRF
ncbi:MAG TPA: TolC family protein [Polyangia bacterium]|nr:TolC family protein [Polyangia bacterium]